MNITEFETASEYLVENYDRDWWKKKRGLLFKRYRHLSEGAWQAIADHVMSKCTYPPGAAMFTKAVDFFDTEKLAEAKSQQSGDRLRANRELCEGEERTRLTGRQAMLDMTAEQIATIEREAEAAFPTTPSGEKNWVPERVRSGWKIDRMAFLAGGDKVDMSEVYTTRDSEEVEF